MKYLQSNGWPTTGIAKRAANDYRVAIPIALSQWRAGADDGHRDVFFPSADWSDFPVVLLSAWLPMLRAVAERRSIGADCHFMDGPFSFAVHATDDDFTLHVIDRQTSARADWTVPAAQFLLALREAGRVVLDACDAAGWDSGDIQALRTELE